MRIVESGVFDPTSFEPTLSSLTFPHIARAPDGRYIATFKGAPQKGPYNTGESVYMSISNDGGATYGTPHRLFDAPTIDGKPTTLRVGYFKDLGNGCMLAALNAVDATMPDLPYYNEETEGLKDTHIVVATSRDHGASWSDLTPIRVPTFDGLPLPLTGTPLSMGDGRIGLQFEVNKPYYSTAYWTHHSAVIYSLDGGKTFSNEVVITDSKYIYYWDQRISPLPGGQVLDIFWTFDRNRGDYINMHLSESLDYGRRFSAPRDIGLSGQPGNIIDAGGGRLLLIYINRDAAPVIRLAESVDGGRSWADALTVYESGRAPSQDKNAGMNDVWSEMGAFSIGHPFITEADSEYAYAYYYSGPSTHRTSLHYAKISL